MASYRNATATSTPSDVVSRIISSILSGYLSMLTEVINILGGEGRNNFRKHQTRKSNIENNLASPPRSSNREDVCFRDDEPKRPTKPAIEVE